MQRRGAARVCRRAAAGAPRGVRAGHGRTFTSTKLDQMLLLPLCTFIRTVGFLPDGSTMSKET